MYYTADPVHLLALSREDNYGQPMYRSPIEQQGNCASCSRLSPMLEG